MVVGKVFFANVYFKYIEGVLFESGVEVQCVRGEHVQGRRRR